MYIKTREAMYVQRNNGARSRNQSCVEKQQLLRTLTIRLQPSLSRMQKNMRRIILPSVAGSAILYFSTLSHQW